MSTGTVDYDALAKQAGGSAVVDYDALASQHGGNEATAPKKDAYGTPPAEIDSFLKSNPNYQFLDSDPKFPNRRPGIYPAGPGNEWRNDPDLNAKKGNVDQFPVDPHLLKHSYESGKQALGVATAPMLFEASLPQILGGLLGGAGGSVAGSSIAKAAGAGETGQEVAGDVGGLAGGMAGSATINYAGSKARAVYEALPLDLQDAIKTQLAKAGKDAAGAAAGYRLKKLIDFSDSLSELKDRFVSYYSRNPGGPLPENPGKDFLAQNNPFQKDVGARFPEKPSAAFLRENQGVYPGAPLPETPLPEQLNPSLVSASRTLPGMNSPEVIRPPAQPIPPRAGLALPAPYRPTVQPQPASAAGSMVESVVGKTPPKADPLTIRLQSIMQDIESHEANSGKTPAETDKDLMDELTTMLAGVKKGKKLTDFRVQ